MTTTRICKYCRHLFGWRKRSTRQTGDFCKSICYDRYRKGGRVPIARPPAVHAIHLSIPVPPRGVVAAEAMGGVVRRG